jgi:hypothetical protein
MKRKILLSAVVIISLFFFLTFLFYFFSEKKEILRKNVWNVTDSLLENNPERAEGYLIKYKKDNFDLVKYIFSDPEKASNFLKEFLDKVEGKTFTTQSSIEVDGYSGFRGISLKPEGIFGIIVKKDNFVIVASGKKEENLIKLIKWFIRKKF